MELHQIAYFVEVAKTGNFSRAAENRHVSQPSLSQQIRKLEEELGEPLFLRQRRGARLTVLGETFLPRAHRILTEVAAAKDDASAFHSLNRGSIRVGAIPTIAPYLLPALVRATRDAFPGLKMGIREESTESLIQLLHTGDLDLGIASPPFPDAPPVEFEELLQDELLVAIPDDHPLAGASSIAVEELAAHPLVLMKDTHCLSRQTRAFCQRAGFELQVAIHSSQLDTTLALVAGGLGLSIVPAMARKAFNHRAVRFASVSPTPFFRSVGLIRTRAHALSRAQQAFIELCRQNAIPLRSSQTARTPPGPGR